MTSGTINNYETRSKVPSSGASDEVVDCDLNDDIRRCARSRLPRLTRLVSQDELFSMPNTSPHYISGRNNDNGTLDVSDCMDAQNSSTRDKDGVTFGRESPMRCVSEFDKVAAASDEESEKPGSICADDTDVSSRDAPPLPNPLRNSKVLSAHVRALRIEAELNPLRVVLSRLMAHPTFNRKGIFNHPVDPVALRLPDYNIIVKRPMDLGSIKARLHAIAYDRQDEVVDDIRLVFRNAMTYNPPGNLVHVAAKSMLEYFNELLATIVSVKDTAESPRSPLGEGAIHATDYGIASQPPTSLCQSSVENENSSASSVTLGLAQDESARCSFSVCAPLGADNPERQVLSSLCDQCANSGSAAFSAMATEGVATSTVNISQTTRSRPPPIVVPNAKPIRRRRASQARALSHSCQACLGRICAICSQGCLPLEPTLLICTGSNCCGSKIRKGATYYIAKDGSRQFCQRCYTNLAAVMTPSSAQDALRYKCDLLKRKNDEEVAERWLTCGKCGTGVHQICAMYNEFVHSDSDIPCPKCHSTSSTSNVKNTSPETPHLFSDLYTYVSGADLPVPMSTLVDKQVRYGDRILSAESLQETAVSSFIQEKVRERMTSSDRPNAERTIMVRIISDCDKEFHVPAVVRKHFRMESNEVGNGTSISPPLKLNYHSQAIALFQKVDGLDVCIFCMYVQEYDGDDVFDSPREQGVVIPQKKRVYIAYLDSVEHFRPRSCRTVVFHEMLVSYLAAARARGYETAHIWACPPSRGNSFVFWNHPASQRTPTKERLEAWYHGALSRAIECGVVTDVQSLYESDFQRCLLDIKNESESNLEKSGRMVCPPLFDGDFWIDEAVRIHSASIARNLKARAPGDPPAGRGSPTDMEGDERCPAIQVATLLRDRLIAHPSSLPFRRPVNAAALKLHDYHKIIVKPMDLGTVYSRCIMGEYRLLRELVSDVQLVFSNAKRYNPQGHVVHDRAIELESYFTAELRELMKSWHGGVTGDIQEDLNGLVDMSMNLDMRLESQSASTDAAPEEISNSNLEKDSTGDAIMTCSDLESPTNAELLNGADQAKTVAPSSHQQNLLVRFDQSQATTPPLHACSKKRASPGKSDLLTKLELLSGGPEAIFQRMVGEDVWLLDKKNPVPPKNVSVGKKSGGKRKRSALDPTEELLKQRRRQAWLGEEVGASVRRMRTSFFSCSLVPSQTMLADEKERLEKFEKYIESFPLRDKVSTKNNGRVHVSHIADARHALHEFSQYRNFEFDTLRRAKYSTAMLLYHLHNDDAPGLVPICSACDQEIREVRWHKVRKDGERLRLYHAASPRGVQSSVEADCEVEELCSKCYAKHPKKGDEFIPLQVSVKSCDS